MDLEIVTVGTELLLGFTLDSNSADIGRAMASEGIRVVRSSTVADETEAIRDAVAGALRRAGIVIVTGGLGPTRDDVTKRAVASIYGAPLELDGAYLEALRSRFANLGRGPMPENNVSQAEFPRGAERLRNPQGTAPGLWLEGEPGATVMLPGIPGEMRSVLQQEVLPRLRRRMSDSGAAGVVTRSLLLRTTGVSESRVAELVAGIEGELEGVSLAFLPGVDGTDLRLTAWQTSAGDAATLLDTAATRLRSVLRENLYGSGDVELAEVLLDGLRVSGSRLAVAESCTGGLVGAKLTSVPGASDVFVGGLIAYSDDAKVRDLGVPELLLEGHGAVSVPVAEAMAEGVRRRFRTEAAVAITGVAGPTGGTADKPVGTVCFAALHRDRSRSVRRWLPGNREEVRQRSAQMALDLLRRLITE